jgi:hypothetical protein
MNYCNYVFQLAGYPAGYQDSLLYGSQLDIRQVKSGTRPDIGYKKGRVIWPDYPVPP